jgi:hypothetical protein
MVGIRIKSRRNQKVTLRFMLLMLLFRIHSYFLVNNHVWSDIDILMPFLLHITFRMGHLLWVSTILPFFCYCQLLKLHFEMHGPFLYGNCVLGHEKVDIGISNHSVIDLYIIWIAIIKINSIFLEQT